MSNIFQSLKPGGEFIFSWEHPIHTKLAYENGQFILNGSFLKEGPETVIWRDVPVVMYRRKVSTFVNELINAGFIIEQIIEESNIPQNDKSNPARWYSGDRAKITPSTLIVKSHKI